jgi:hypothetical protein
VASRPSMICESLVEVCSLVREVQG